MPAVSEAIHARACCRGCSRAPCVQAPGTKQGRTWVWFPPPFVRLKQDRALFAIEGSEVRVDHRSVDFDLERFALALGHLDRVVGKIDLASTRT